MTTATKFTMNTQHLTLLRNAYVSWQGFGNEIGAPEIDVKRPYGNKSVLSDIHWLLTGERVGIVGSKRKRLSKREEKKYLKLHQETEIALQIILHTGEFVIGNYERSFPHRNWRFIQP